MSLVRKCGAAFALVPFLLMLGCKDATKDTPAPAAQVEDPAAVHPEIWPSPKWPFEKDAALEEKVAALLKKMTLEEKVGQVVQGDICCMKPEDMKKYHLGSILAGGGSGPGGNDKAPPQVWLQLADDFYTASIDTSNGGVGIPMIWGIDAMHGHSNIVGAVLFPHNVGLGATRNPKLLGEIARVTAEQVRTTGIDWTFAPTVTVPQDDRWGRSYEGYSEDPGVVASYAGAFVKGLQGEPGSPDFLSGHHVISSTKHFLADGGTDQGRDQGDARIPETTLRDIHNAGYVPAIEAGVQTIMISFSSWNGAKHSGNKGLMTEAAHGRYLPAASIDVLPEQAYLHELLASLLRSRAEGRKLMEKHGYGPNNRLPVKVATRNIAQYRDPAVILIDQMKQIYIDGELEVVETANWFPKIARKDFMMAGNLTGSGVDDPDAYFYEHYACGSERNYTNYCNPELEKMYEQQSVEPDQEKRKQIVWEIDRRLTEDAARPILYRYDLGTCRYPRVKNTTTMVNSIFNSWRLEDAWLDQ